jgi:5-methylcytosine-specific restriction endonuclease McrA
LPSKILQKINDTIKGKAPLSASRSSEWPKVRNEHLSQHPVCELCGGKDKLEVHHIEPFHLHPELELDSNNLITLCESASNGVICHLFAGHKGNYKNYNASVKTDVENFKNFLKDEGNDGS